MNFLQTSQKLKNTTPANENQADFPQKPPKITTRSLPEFIQSLPPVCAYLLWSLPPGIILMAYNRGPGVGGG